MSQRLYPVAHPVCKTAGICNLQPVGHKVSWLLDISRDRMSHHQSSSLLLIPTGEQVAFGFLLLAV